MTSNRVNRVLSLQSGDLRRGSAFLVYYFLVIASYSRGQVAADALQSFRLLRGSTLLKTIAVLICLSSIVTTAAGWQLKAMVKDFYVEKNAVAAFLSSFRGYTGVVNAGSAAL